MLHLRKPSAALTVSPSALVLLAAFLLLSRGLTLPAALLSAALCHELAHVLTLHALHAPPRRLTLSATGAELYVPDLHRLSYGGELLPAAAGPVSNLLLAAAMGLLGRWWEPLYLLAGTQAVLGCFNLLPILPLDGGRMLWLALCWGTDPFLADRVAQAVSLAAAGLLTVAGAALARRSPFLLWTAAALLVCAAAPCIKRRRSVYASHKGR